MKPRRPSSSRALVVLAAILVLLSAATAMAQERAALPDSDRHAVLATVLAMHRGEYPTQGPSVRVFETGGGDPAMNGSFLYLAIDHNDRSLVWKMGLNVRRIRKMSFAPANSILLLVDEDVMDAASTITKRSATYRIRFTLDGGVLGETVYIDRK